MQYLVCQRHDLPVHLLCPAPSVAAALKRHGYDVTADGAILRSSAPAEVVERYLAWCRVPEPRYFAACAEA